MIDGKGHHGVFAIELVKAGEILVIWGGSVYSSAELERIPNLSLGVQVDDDLYLVPHPEEVGPGDWVNHSCQPNAGIGGQISVIAMRDIAPGEEVCYDYAMTDGSPYDEFTCECNTPTCRKRITGNDWQIPVLWERYDGYFSAYLQRRIEKLKHELQYPKAGD